jgi:hypothetical protein
MSVCTSSDLSSYHHTSHLRGHEEVDRKKEELIDEMLHHNLREPS